MKTQEEKLYHLRKAVKDFIDEIQQLTPPKPMIEVGKMLAEGKVYDMFPEFYVDTKVVFKDQELLQLDIDPQTNPDICDDIININQHVKDGSVGSIILLHVIEHVTRIWKLPEILHKALAPDGMLFIQTPWNFRFHGPRPDCWRISDDGYEALFGEYFDIVKLEKINPFDDYLHPLVINVVLRKKSV